MKAKNLNTGEIVDNFAYSKEYGTVSFIDSEGILRYDGSSSGTWQILPEEEQKQEVMTMDTNRFKGLMSDYAIDKRTQAAISAMNGICANFETFEDIIKMDSYPEGISLVDGVAKLAVACADALLSKLEETKLEHNEKLDSENEDNLKGI